MAEAFPLSWHINTDDVYIHFLMPKFHLPAHIEMCHQFFSFNYAKFVGQTDGELWSADGWILMVLPTALKKWDLEHNRTPSRTI